LAIQDDDITNRAPKTLIRLMARRFVPKPAFWFARPPRSHRIEQRQMKA
jgi:hypothetical protein